MAESRLQRTRDAYVELCDRAHVLAARRAWERRHAAKFPFKTRWHIYQVRAMATSRRWRDVWDDLIYLVKG